MDYRSLTHKKLKELSQKEGLPVKGNKQELIDGLEKLQRPAIEVIAANVSKVVAPVSAPVVENAPVVKESSQPQCSETAMEIAPPAAAAPGAGVTLAIRRSSRGIRPRICTICVGCSHHPTHSTRKAAAAPAVVDELADKLANVNIVPRHEEKSSAKATDSAASKPGKTSKPRSTTIRAPLKAKSNEATEESTVVAAGPKQAKPGKAKSMMKEVASLKDLAAENGKENLPSQLDAAVKTERPARKVRSLKQVTA